MLIAVFRDCLTVNKEYVMEALSLSIPEVKAATGLGLTRIYQLINNGELKCRKIGKRSLVLKSDLEEFLNNLDSYPVKSQGE